MTTIKITALTDIGANIPNTTLIPVVDMTGTPTTDKATFGNVANAILSQAGNNYSAAAKAVTVTASAQPNITSVGTLSSLTTTGNVTADFYFGDGGFLSNVTGGNAIPGGSNSQVQYNNAGDFAGDSDFTYDFGNNILNVIRANASYLTAYESVATANISANGLATIARVNVTNTANLGAVGNVTITGGTNGQVLTTNGTGGLSWTTVSGGGSYSNSNVASYLPTYTGDLGGSNLNVPPTVDFNLNTDDGNGNISSWTFTADGDLYWPGPDDHSIYNGASNSFVIHGHNNIIISTDGANANYQYQFYANGDLGLPGNVSATVFSGNGSGLSSIAGANVTGTVGNANLSQYLAVSDVNNNFSYHIVLSAGSGDKSLHIDADDNLQYNPADGTLTSTRVDATYVLANLNYANGYLASNLVGSMSSIANGNSNVSVPNASDNVYITTNNGTSKQWIFNTTGSLRTPGNVDIYGAINFPQQVSNINWSTYNIELSQYGRINTNVDFFANANTIGAQYLKGDGSNITNVNAVQVVNGTSNITVPTTNGNAVITTNTTNQWLFDTNGNLTLPNDANIAIYGNTTQFNTCPNGFLGLNSYDAGGNNIARVGISSADKLVGIGVSDPITELDYNWTFTNGGGTIFPTLTVDLHNGGNQTAQTLQFGDPAQQAIITGPTPATGDSAQRLIIQGQRANGTYAEGGDVYVWGGDSDYNGGDIKIYAGDSDGATGGGGYINLAGGDGADTGGYINIDGGYGSNGSGGYINITGGTGGNSIGGNIQIQGGQSSGTGINGANVLLQGGYSQSANGGAVTVRGGQSALGLSGYGNVLVEAGASGWTFDNTGTLTVPQNIHGSGALQLQGLANGNTTINIGSGVGGDIDMVSNLGNINLYTASNQPWIFDQGGNLTAPGAINVGNMSIGQLTGVITANNNTTVALNVSGSDGGFVVDYIGIEGNANSSGGELAFNSELGNATYRISLSDDLGDGFATKIWRFDGTGNLTLPTNAFTVNYANGTQVSLGGAGNTGNVTFDNQVVIGTGDEYGGGGLYLAPGTNSTANLQYLRVRGGDYPTHIHLDTGNNQYYDQYFGADSRYVKLEANGNIVINADDYSGNSGTWTFTTGGNLVLAGGNSVIQSIANSSLDPINPNVSTMVLTPDPGYSSQALVLDPTAPGHIHLRAPGANIDEPAANLFLGGEDSSFEVGYYTGSAPNVFVHSNNYTWTFDNTGNLTFPDNSVQSTAAVAEASFSIQSSNFNATAGSRYGVNTSGGAVTATLPASPATGVAIFFADAGGAYASNNLTIDPNGGTIMGASGNMTVSTNNQSVGLFYNGTTWRTYNAG